MSVDKLKVTRVEGLILLLLTLGLVLVSLNDGFGIGAGDTNLTAAERDSASAQDKQYITLQQSQINELTQFYVGYGGQQESDETSDTEANENAADGDRNVPVGFVEVGDFSYQLVAVLGADVSRSSANYKAVLKSLETSSQKNAMKLVKVGDSLNDSKVVDIGPEHIVVKRVDEKYRIDLFPTRALTPLDEIK